MNSKENEPILLERGDGLGWTLNFKNKWSYLILAALIGLILFALIDVMFFN